MNQRLLQLSTGANVLRCLGVVLLTFVVFTPLILLFQASSDGQMPLDNQISLTVDSIFQQMLTYQPSAKWVYLGFFAVDMVFPLAFSLLFSLFIGWCLNKAPNSTSQRLVGMGILILPFGSALADWLENIGNVIVIFSYPTQLETVASFAVALKGIKFSLLGLNICLALAVGLCALAARPKQ